MKIRIPIISSLFRQFFRKFRRLIKKTSYRGDAKKKFTDIYKNNSWGSCESVSGPGSEIKETQSVIDQLPKIFNDYEIESILDLPCGDFNWMKLVGMSKITYIGGDVVEEIVSKDNKLYSKEGRVFQNLNIISDDLPKVDLVFCRDCLFHFSYKDAFKALANIVKSGSKYLMTTSFVNRNENENILTGEFYRINLEKKPFCFPAPILAIDESGSEDKFLLMWHVSDIETMLKEKGRIV